MLYLSYSCGLRADILDRSLPKMHFANEVIFSIMNLSKDFGSWAFSKKFRNLTNPLIRSSSGIERMSLERTETESLVNICASRQILKS